MLLRAGGHYIAAWKHLMVEVDSARWDQVLREAEAACEAGTQLIDPVLDEIRSFGEGECEAFDPLAEEEEEEHVQPGLDDEMEDCDVEVEWDEPPLPAPAADSSSSTPPSRAQQMSRSLSLRIIYGSPSERELERASSSSQR